MASPALDGEGPTRNLALAGGSPPEFSSTHPPHASRIEDLREHMSAALETYKNTRRTDEPPTCEQSSEGLALALRTPVRTASLVARGVSAPL